MIQLRGVGARNQFPDTIWIFFVSYSMEHRFKRINLRKLVCEPFSIESILEVYCITA